MAYRRRPPKFRYICYSCVTGQPVWLYQGQSSEGMRKAYWRAAKKEQTRARWFQRRTDRRTRRIQHLLDECLAAIPILGKLTKEQREAVRRLAAAGLARYEISNYARRGFACRHNLVYWSRGAYLGLGCAAHSLLGGRRFRNPDGLDAYLSGVRRLDEEALTLEDGMEETLMLSTRTARGLDLAAWRRAFGAPFGAGRQRALARLREGGLIEIRDGFLRLTLRGMEVQNAVVLELLEAEE